jgi:hypothetical protein
LFVPAEVRVFDRASASDACPVVSTTPESNPNGTLPPRTKTAADPGLPRNTGEPTSVTPGPTICRAMR